MHLPSPHTLLDWYLAMGVTETMADAPINHLIEQSVAESDTIKPAEAPPTGIPNLSTGLNLRPAAKVTKKTPNIDQSLAAILAEATAKAADANTLDELVDAIESFEGCSIRKTASNTVIYDGIPYSDIMLIGEAPGAEEDRQGIPFCGPSGRLLDNMLAWISLSRKENFLITNTLYWRPPGNRAPTTEELMICEPFVQKMIALNKPKLILLIGGTAAKSVLKETRGITRLRREKFTYTHPSLDDDIPIRVLFHPSYLLRQPLQKKLAWEDLLSIKAQIKTWGMA